MDLLVPMRAVEKADMKAVEWAIEWAVEMVVQKERKAALKVVD